MPEVRVDEVRRFMEDSLRAVGAPDSEAKAHAALLLHADITGHFSHGLNRLAFYVNDISTGATNAHAKPVILKESAATAWVDGADALGSTVGNFCMDIAIKKAKECGVGWVVAKRSNHFGMAGWWALKAEREGLIGLAWTNSSPVSVPTRSKKGTLGTNPVAMFAPATGGDYIGVDMASTTVAMGKIEMQIHKKEPLPEGWALGTDGKVTTDAHDAFKAASLLPLGGLESTGGYKGYGLTAIGEVFCSGLSGSRSSHQVPKWSVTKQGEPMNLGQCYAAIDPSYFAPGFGERIADCLRTWRNLEPVDPQLPVLAPGDKERINTEQTTKRGTIIYPEAQIESCNSMAQKMPDVRIEDVQRFMEDSFRAVGTPASEAKAQAALLLHADLTCHFSHGLNRLELYINDIKTGMADPKAKPIILKESAATAWVDGRNSLGATVGTFCMEVAIRKAKESGVGWVSAKGCNHFGMAGYWAQMAQREGLIGLAWTNSSPVMVPTRSKQRCMGTNPIALFAPAADGDYLGVDMSSTAVAMGKVEMQIHKNEPIPEGWALGPDGEVTTDAELALKTGNLLPLGGCESTGGYKGYGLSAIGEVFCSGLSGSNPTHKVARWTFSNGTINSPRNLGQCFAAINPEYFAPGFAERLSVCLTTWRGLEPVDPSLPVLVHGDKERTNIEQTRRRGTINYPQKQIDTTNALANRIGVKPLQVL
ncbi:uncharacterized protein LOC113521987 [Galleria mellonella]|uniref:Uncharacterized protein LOC113521987 n=1 Tax=Galleria mellonella TaxID=7137 RepID=A0ABM3MWQ1_GALME|nr:uncharacterized protein LOC113521987 [Galleria mellonella]